MKKTFSSRLGFSTIFTFVGVLLLILGIGTGVYFIGQRVGVKPRASEVMGESSVEEEVLLGKAVQKKVWLIVWDPIIKTNGDVKLSQYYEWNDFQKLSDQLVSDFKEISNGYLNYSIVGKNEINGFPKFKDGFTYDKTTFLKCWQDPKHASCHTPTGNLDYQYVLQKYKICEKVNAGEVDELWLWAFPYSSIWEAAMAGPGAFDINGEIVENTTCKKKLPIMGFNYERGLGAALESYGHRTENTLTKVFHDGWNGYDPNYHPILNKDAWITFTIIDKQISGQARCGYIHFAPQTREEYNWSQKGKVPSACDDWYSYPDLPTEPNFVDVSCKTWGCDPETFNRWIDKGYEFKKWWFKHLPHAALYKKGVANNWWKYLVDYDKTVNTKVAATQCKSTLYANNNKNKPGKYNLVKKVTTLKPGQNGVYYTRAENVGNVNLTKLALSVTGEGSFEMKDGDDICEIKKGKFSCDFTKTSVDVYKPGFVSGGAVRISVPDTAVVGSSIKLNSQVTSKEAKAANCEPFTITISE